MTSDFFDMIKRSQKDFLSGSKAISLQQNTYCKQCGRFFRTENNHVQFAERYSSEEYCCECTIKQELISPVLLFHNHFFYSMDMIYKERNDIFLGINYTQFHPFFIGA